MRSLVLWSPSFGMRQLHESYKEEIQKNGVVIRKRNLTGEEIRVGKEMWEDFKKYDTAEPLREISAPILAVVGSEDHLVKPEVVAAALQQHEGKHHVEVIPNCDHDFLDEKSRKLAIQTTLNWLEENF